MWWHWWKVEREAWWIWDLVTVALWVQSGCVRSFCLALVNHRFLTVVVFKSSGLGSPSAGFHSCCWLWAQPLACSIRPLSRMESRPSWKCILSAGRSLEGLTFFTWVAAFVTILWEFVCYTSHHWMTTIHCITLSGLDNIVKYYCNNMIVWEETFPCPEVEDNKNDRISSPPSKAKIDMKTIFMNKEHNTE